MKQLSYHIWLLCCTTPFLAVAQGNPHWDVKRHQRTYYGEDGTRHQFSYLAEKQEVSTHNKRSYAWYDNKIIHTTQGGYSGKLLDGPYYEFHPNRQLKTQGTYKKGLSKGKWYHWSAAGQITSIRSHHKGKLVKEKKPPKKMNPPTKRAEKKVAKEQAKVPSKRWFRKRQEQQTEIKEPLENKPKRRKRKKSNEEGKEKNETE